MMSSPGVWDISPLRAEMIHVLRFQGADLEVFGAHQESSGARRRPHPGDAEYFPDAGNEIYPWG